jgi:uncharacterized protein (DUF2249 family)
MEHQTTTLDLREERSSHLQSAAFYTLSEMAQGQSVILLIAEEPSLMMQSLNLQMRHNLSYEIRAAEDGWRVEVRRREDVAVQDVPDALMRDHKRMNALLGSAIQHLNRGDAAGAAPLLHDLAAVLKRHIEIEDGLLAPLLAPAVVQPHDAPQVIMHREHGEILAQLSLIEECLAQEPLPTGELAAYSSILSGTLAKHEYREENNLFPRWYAALARLPQDRCAALLAEISGRLGQH